MASSVLQNILVYYSYPNVQQEMLQRAASNAYSWWWASHIRTKQSKWLQQCLQDMEEKVHIMLTMIEEDGDSFAKRAEMYYKRRPELIQSVEEAYKTFRALADRYDMLSKEMQNANHTIAIVFPDQVQFGFEDDDDFPMLKPPTDLPPPPSAVPANAVPTSIPLNVPQVPRLPPSKDLKRVMSVAAKQLNTRKSMRARSLIKIEEAKSGLSKDEALEEINKLQKEILALQTVKEYIKSSYENGVAKYWEIENQIMSMQKRVSSLQDEFNIGSVIQDNEARTMMAEAALKSCQETLAKLQERQEKVSQEAAEEYKRIEAACQRLQSIRQKYLNDENEPQSLSKDTPEKEIELVAEKGQEDLNLSFGPDMTVTQMANKIDELVSKVIGLETAISSQAVLVRNLRSETDDLNAQICVLDEKANQTNGIDKLRMRVEKVEEKLNKVQDLNKNLKRQNSDLQTNFTEARTSIDCLSERLSSVKLDEEVDEHGNESALQPEQDKLIEGTDGYKDFSSVDNRSYTEMQASDATETEQEVQKEIRKTRSRLLDRKLKESKAENDIMDVHKQDLDAYEARQDGEVKKEIKKMGLPLLDREPKEAHVEEDIPDNADDDDDDENVEKAEEMNWQQMLLNGMEDREKILIKEYKALLRSYKDLKKKLHELEKNEKDNEFDVTLQMRELEKAIAKKDEENQYLCEKLKSLQGKDDPNTNEEAKDVMNEDGIKEIKSIYINQLPSLSNVEGKIRGEIDEILDENLEFWLSFSTAIHEVQKFRMEVQDLQGEMSKLREKRRRSWSTTMQLISEVRAIYKHLKEIQRELTVWLDQSVPMKDELKSRFASLCRIQEEITNALKEGVVEDPIRFQSHQAAKFQGEIMNMKHENNMVREEMKGALNIVRMLQVEVEKMLRQLNQEYTIGYEETMNQSKVPLRSFLFGAKKKQKASFFSCMLASA